MRKRPAATTAALLTVCVLTGGLIRTAVAAPDQATGGGRTGKTAVATATESVTHEENERVPEGARWTQHYFPSSDGSKTELHADVLLPENLPAGAKVPVIVSASAYFGHSGQLEVEEEHSGPSERFQDLVEGTDLFDKGYAFVMVDTRGFGGSTGCLDLGGPGDQADVEAAIDWSAKQPWSTGAVGMYGKSFDAYTGLLGNNVKHDALKAVVAQEPIWDLYQQLHSNGVPRPNSVQVPTTYNRIAGLAQLPDDDKRYRTNAAYETKHPECLALNAFGPSIGDPDDPYWKDRSPARNAKGTDTPLLFTQGTAEPNTLPVGMEEFLDHHRGPQRGWVGPWDHVRGNERTPDGKLAMGRANWFKETLSFFDEHLKGIDPKTQYPNYAVQDSLGYWRAEKSWPTANRSANLRLGNGSYVDSGAGSQPTSPEEEAGRDAGSFFVWSEPLETATRVTGTPRVTMTAKGEGNVMVKLYDVDEDGNAVAFDERVSRLDRDRLDIGLKSTDWTLRAGHRLAAEIGSVQTGDWLDTPSKQKIRITDARLHLPMDNPADDIATGGDRAPWLDTFKQINAAKLKPGPATFSVPPVRARR
ncbi:CocE/NonD family hydrolase [Streptomyces ureilyticus]|uniref:CocE/NonD family hydrolase n=1 Tax=Streptomyces ureilyticus TaxID=1775131 RepID=A0ABX0DYB1_9ACTN|nr:CocE/NonD family hydrolase [Streptomyces ureilyticus]NGO46933.1 CocE/NonD family hydrolase [Streptomyces ureilyticus]